MTICLGIPAITGEFDIRMITLTHTVCADVWHWKWAYNSVGWVDDKRHIISQKANPEWQVEYSMGGHGDVSMARIMDEVTSSYSTETETCCHLGKVVDSFEQSQAGGSFLDFTWEGNI